MLLDHRLVGVFFSDVSHIIFEVLEHGCWTSSFLELVTDGSAVALDCDGDLVDAFQDFKGHRGVVMTEVLGLKRDVDCVLHVWQELALRWVGFEIGDLREAEVDRHINILVLNCKCHIPTVVGLAFTECKELPVDLDFRVRCSCHHLDLEVCMLEANLAIFVKLNDCKRCVLLGSHVEFELVSHLLDTGTGLCLRIRAVAHGLALLLGHGRSIIAVH